MSKLALLLLLSGASIAAAQNKMGIWSPLYLKINPSTGDEYAKFIDSVANNKCLQSSFQGVVLSGPTSQPPPLKNTKSPGQQGDAAEYQRRFDYMIKAGDWQPFGYVYTNYGKRPKAAILDDVAAWCDPVNGYRASVRGIFIDQVAATWDCAKAGKGESCLKDGDAFYQEIIDAINKACVNDQYGAPMIILNPGRAFDECEFMAKNKITFVNAWEDTYETYEKFSANKLIDCACKDKGVRCIASIHSVPADITADQAAAVMKDMATNGFSAIFMTENKYPKHYETVPTIWPVVAKAACDIDAYTPKRR